MSKSERPQYTFVFCKREKNTVFLHFQLLWLSGAAFSLRIYQYNFQLCSHNKFSNKNPKRKFSFSHILRAMRIGKVLPSTSTTDYSVPFDVMSAWHMHAMQVNIVTCLMFRECYIVHRPSTDRQRKWNGGGRSEGEAGGSRKKERIRIQTETINQMIKTQIAEVVQIVFI